MDKKPLPTAAELSRNAELPTVEPLPSYEEFFLKTPLYKDLKVGVGIQTWVSGLMSFTGTVDAHCVNCQQSSVFRGSEPSNRVNGWEDQYISINGGFTVVLKCTRCTECQILTIFRLRAGILTKIGQYPSLADLQFPELKKYQKILGPKQFNEFAKGIGLVSHGVGIGAFVYLRRIFENLIEEAHKAAQADDGWDEATYAKCRMADKISLLKAHLPNFLVENAALYSILSKGIHELSEDECLEYFDAVKLGIEMILDEKIERLARQKKTELAKQQLAAIKSKLS